MYVPSRRVKLRLVVENGNTTTTIEDSSEYLPDILESVKLALIAAGFSYVESVDYICHGEEDNN